MGQLKGMVKLSERFLNLIYGNSEKLKREGQKIEAENLRLMLGRCSVCEQEFTGHSYARFALTPLTKENGQHVNDFLRALREHRWSDVIKFRDYEALSDALGAHALRCAGRQIVWLAIRDPFEPGDTQSIIEQGILDHEDSRVLEAAIGRVCWVSLET